MSHAVQNESCGEVPALRSSGGVTSVTQRLFAAVDQKLCTPSCLRAVDMCQPACSIWPGARLVGEPTPSASNTGSPGSAPDANVPSWFGPVGVADRRTRL